MIFKPNIKNIGVDKNSIRVNDQSNPINYNLCYTDSGS